MDKHNLSCYYAGFKDIKKKGFVHDSLYTETERLSKQ